MSTGIKARLSSIGSVAETYQHYEKVIAPAEGIDLENTYLKWYDIAMAEAPIDPALQREARRFLQAEAQSWSLDLAKQLGFVVLHRCGESFYFLLVQSWRGNNELWETVYYRDADTNGFKLFPRNRSHIGTFCVWELGAVWHEQGAWSRFLRSPRDEASIQTYLGDQYSGTV
ncbi:MAG: hypothetical protein ACRDHN_11325 [Thermomicrobiales bacterium]